MRCPKLAAILFCFFFLSLGGAAQAYHFDTIYSPDANYAYGEAYHYTKYFLA